MDLSIYQVILGPVFSNKAFILNKKFNKLTLDVHPEATSAQIKEALRKVFNIEKVTKINILSRQGKTKRFKGRESSGVFRKRAIITLAKDQSSETLNSMNLAQVVQ